MSDNIIFDPEKITLVDFKMIKGQVETPENFDISKVVGHQLDKSLQLGFNLEDKLAKADFTVKVKTKVKPPVIFTLYLFIALKIWNILQCLKRTSD